MPRPRPLTSRPTPDKPAVLLTGFGPFPGVPENASAELVRALSKAARRTFPRHAFHARILPTEWARAPHRVTVLYDQFDPVLALHFGVATGSATIRLESCAHNVCRAAPDAAGRPPLAAVLKAGGAELQAATWPISALARRMRAKGLPVSTSHDAGGYLCNAVLYHALSHAEASGRPIQIGFIHVPDDLTSPPVTLSVALQAGLEIIDACLNAGAPRAS